MDIVQEKSVEAPKLGLFGKLNASIRKQIRKSYFEWHLRHGVREKNFSIISNNCWGGRAYSDAKIEYLTPTIGLFIEPACYVRFVSDLRRNLTLPLSFLPRSRYESINHRRENELGNYPIGLLNDSIEIHFQHYESEDEARRKWTRRASRMAATDERLFVKFDDFNATPAQLVEFDALPLPHKVAILGRPRPEIRCGVHVKKCGEAGLPRNGNDQYWVCQSDLDLADWFNGGSGEARGFYKFMTRLVQYP